MSGQIIVRTGGTAELVYGPPTSHPRRTVQRARTDTPPSEYMYRDVELRDTGFVNYSVRLSHYVRKAIEVGGWLFSQYAPRADTDFLEVAHVTRSSERPGTNHEVFLDDPAAAEVAVHAMGLRHLKVVGDWHCHVYRGSELPSLQDARAWCGTMDRLGREAYVSVIASPSREQGWLFPRFSAWVAGSYGDPPQPVVGRARLGC